ncbi:hypothetical protein [Alcanivorax sp.]|uniref:hypothetical protein n=1 Tax=Alcanivorax sp. TaxID=1872427 RepID=UPI0025859ADA|nr:hypothetical protein [Alcanivorax sp.]
MTMDHVQVVSLMLEIVGFGLAAIQIYHANYRESSKRFFEMLESLTTITNRPYGIFQVDYDFETDEEKTLAEQSNVFAFLVFYLVILPILLNYLDFGEGILWGIIEVVVSFFLGAILVIPAQIILHISLSLLIRAYIYLSTIAGRGDRIGGIGLTLAVIGIFLETLQVWFGPFQTAVYWIWLPILSAVVIFVLLKYKKRLS